MGKRNRCICFLLALIMVLSVVPCMSVTAHAESIPFFASKSESIFDKVIDTISDMAGRVIQFFSPSATTDTNENVNSSIQPSNLPLSSVEGINITEEVPTVDAYTTYRKKVDTIRNDQLRNTVQYHRLNKDMVKITGICNLCSMETLLNRRVAYSYGDYSNPFDDYKMFDAIGVRDLGNGPYEYSPGKLGYYLSGTVGAAQRNETKYSYLGSVSFHPVLLGNQEVTRLINQEGENILNAQYRAIAKLLTEHPEGIWLRTEYNVHAIVITDYTVENGIIQLYAIDPVNVRKGVGRKPIEELYFYSNNYTNGIIGDISNSQYRINIAYLQEESNGAPQAILPMQESANQLPTLSISNQTVPDFMTSGSNFGIRGIISSDCGVITQVHGAIKDTYGNEVQSCDFTPNSTSHDLRYSVNNKLMFGSLPAGAYTYFVSAHAQNGFKETDAVLIAAAFRVETSSPDTGNTTQIFEPTAVPTVEDDIPVISISEQNTPTTLKQGSNFGIRGKLSVSCGIITEVYGKILDANGSVVMSAVYTPNTTAHDLRYSINNDFTFGTLPAGSYTYFVSARAKNGLKEAEKILIQEPFYIEGQSQPAEIATQPTIFEPAPTVAYETPIIQISGQTVPTALNQGGNFGIRGTVSTTSGIITEVQGVILNSSGIAVMSSSYYPNESTHDLRYSINNDLVFGTLPAGNYTYYVYAKAVNGSQSANTELIRAPFLIAAPASAPVGNAEPELNSVGKNMTVNVGKGSTLRFCSTVSVADAYEIGSIPNDAAVWVYGTTRQQFEDRTWAKISYNGIDGWVNYKWLK